MKSVSVVIPNYNGKALLEAYLPHTIRALEYSLSVGDYELIVVDDASTDDSITFLQSTYPQIILLRNEKNTGFSQTINKGIKTAEKELVFLLNNDMELPQDIFNHLCPLFDTDENMFGVFPTIKDSTGSKILEAQKLPVCSGTTIGYTDNAAQQKKAFSFYLCGGNALVDRKKLLELDGFCTIYSPFYFEDFDLSLRAWKRGWTCYYTPDTYCLHCHSATINSNFSKENVRRIFLRNRLILNYIHTEGRQFKLFCIKNLFKYILSYIAPSQSKKSFREAYGMFRKKKREIKEIKKEELKKQKYNLAEVLQNYFGSDC